MLGGSAEPSCLQLTLCTLNEMFQRVELTLWPLAPWEVPFTPTGYHWLTRLLCRLQSTMCPTVLISCDMVPASADAWLPVTPADTESLVPAANPVADDARGSEQAKHNREVAVAELVLGEDLELLGGTAPIANFQQLADTETCGKMAALQKLLALWHADGGNKVRLKECGNS